MAGIIATVLVAVYVVIQSAVAENCCAGVKPQLLSHIAGLQTLANGLGEWVKLCTHSGLISKCSLIVSQIFFSKRSLW